MFTLEQIKTAHSKMRSGADFPIYIKAMKDLGVTSYETFVSDGHTDFFGANDYRTSSTAKYEAMEIAATSNAAAFKLDLIAHQQGKKDFQAFCNDCAKSGIEKWTVLMKEMTCTYYDKAGNVVLLETVPAI